MFKLDKNIYFLVYLYFSFILNVVASNKYVKLLTLILAFIYVVYICYRTEYIDYSINIELVLLIFYLSGYFFVGLDLYSLNFLILIYILSTYNKITKININDFLKYLNYTYALYLVLSLLLYFGIIKPWIVNRAVLNSFNINLFNYNVKTMIGFEGSTANIDSYSGLILLLNLLLNNENGKYIWCFITMIVMISTFRLTPIVALLFILVIFVVLTMIKHHSKKLLSSVLFKIINYITFSLVCISFTVPYILEKIYINFRSITHGRSVLWNKYIDIIANSKLKYIIFGYRADSPSVREEWGNLGIWLYTSNPHSSYMRILISMGSIIFLLYISYLIINIMKTDFKYRVIIFYIFICAITNQEILGINNPIYLIVIYYFINNGILKDTKQNIKQGDKIDG